jgi:photosystem II stability/assembly factor-like uncharacterized protein
MSSLNYTPAKNAYSRVFLIKRRARGDHAPSFQSCLIAGSVEQAFGDIERIECPDPDEYGGFIEVGTIRGAEERPTTSLTGRYASDIASELLQLAKIKCASDVQIHFGSCEDPSDFNNFSKAIVLEEAFLTNVSTEELGAIESGGQAAINESADLAAKSWYEVLPLTFSERAGSVVTVEVVDITFADKIGCGECEDEGDGCEKIYGITVTAGGSPGTPADCVYSLDGGTTWYAEDIDGLAANDGSAIAVIGTYVVGFSNASESLLYLLKSELNGTGPEGTWTEVATGFVASSGPNDAWSVGTKAFIVGDGGYIYATEDPTAGVTVLDAGVATAQDLSAVHALSKEMAVAVGAAGAVVYTLDGTTWTAVTAPAAEVLQAVWMKSKKEWWVGSASGNLWYTTDSGATWTAKSFSGSGAGSVHDIAFATDSVAYLSHSTATPAGRILRSYDGGYTWNVLPEGSGTLPANDQVTALAACENDPNIIVGAGLGDDGTDGYIVLGQD